MFLKRTTRALFWLAVLAVCLMTVYPFAVMISGSFKTQVELNRYPLRIIPREWTLQNFQTLFIKIPFWRQFLNSFTVAGISAVGAMLLNGLVAYGFTRFSFRGKKVLFGIVLATMLVPSQVFMVPSFLLYRNLGLFGTYVPLIVPFISSASGIFLIRQVMGRIPHELYESATIDGCGELATYVRIAIPLCASGIGIHGVLTFMSAWNDYMMPLIYLNSEKSYTLSLGLTRLQDFYNIDYGTPLAGALLSCIPVVVLLSTLGQKYFVQGLIGSAVKG